MFTFHQDKINPEGESMTEEGDKKKLTLDESVLQKCLPHLHFKIPSIIYHFMVVCNFTSE